MEQYIFTPSSVLDLLTQIDELKEYDIGLTETFDNQFRLTIGDSVYDINSENPDIVSIDDSALNNIVGLNEDTYEDLQESGSVEIENKDVDITSGIIKEALKTLLVGGMVRLTGKLLRSK